MTYAHTKLAYSHQKEVIGLYLRAKRSKQKSLTKQEFGFFFKCGSKTSSSNIEIAV